VEPSDTFATVSRSSFHAQGRTALALPVILCLAIDCGRADDADDAPPRLALPESTATEVDAAAVLARARGAFAGALVAPTDARPVRSEGGTFAIDGHRPSAGSVALPTLASGEVELAHAASGVRVYVALEGSAGSPGYVVDGLVVYPRGAPHGGDLVQRPTPGGVEDYAVFYERPAKPELRYALRLEQTRALRLHAGRLEVLDAVGAPRVRVEPPYVIDREGARHSAALAIEGCPVDTDPRVPWRREPVGLGGDRAGAVVVAATCTLVVTWPETVDAPLLVDPEWRFAANMSHERTHHTATLLATNDILVAGGFDVGELAIAETEIFCPDDVCAPTGAFTAGPLLDAARGGHTATLLANGQVLITGGAAAYATSGGLSSAELYDPSQPAPDDIVTLPAMSAARIGHTATLLPSGTAVLVAGGDGASPSTAQVYDGLSQTFGAAVSMSTSRRFHVAELAGNARVLVAGGATGAPVASSTAELFDPVGGTFTPLPSNMTANRAFATATRIEDGQGSVLVVGGTNLQGFYSPTADLFVPSGNAGSFVAQPIVMQVGRATHSATALVGTSTVLVSGGYNAAGVLDATEIFEVGDTALQLYSVMGAPHNFHAAVRQASGRPVVIGGGKEGTATTPGSGNVLVASAIRAEILFRSNGEPCDDAEECSSKHCYDLDGGPGICCDETCSDPCRSCRAADTADPLDTDGFCSVVEDNHPVSTQCANDVEFSLVCVGGNISIQGGQVQPCNGYSCDAAGDACLTQCANDSDCDDEHFCGSTTCFEKKLQGEVCAQANECQSDRCVDGFCCNSDCLGQCEACDVENSEGVCVQVPSGAPHGSRVACDGAGTACEGSCGTNPAKCDYAQVACGDSTCQAGVQTAGICSTVTDGECTLTDTPCGAFACDPTGEVCFSSCIDTEQCADGAICRSDGTCAAVSSTECDDSILVEPNGNSIDCAPFRCDGAACLTRCVSVDDCVEGKVCDGAGACVDPPPDPAPPEDCAYRPIDPSRSGGRGAWALLGLGLLALRARHRRGGR